MRRWLGTLGVGALATPALLVLASGLASCREPLAAPIPAAHPDDPTPRRGGVVRLASVGQLKAIDPAVTADKLGAAVIEEMFAGLVDFDQKGVVVPDLAERWDVLDDGRTYRFSLHPGARFHDGAEVTADDVKRSVERTLHPSTASPHASWYGDIDGFEAYTNGRAPHLDGVTVDGRYVVSFHIARSDATFLPRLALYPLRPVCKSAGDRYADGWTPCGAGPFKLATWDGASALLLARHEGYFRPGLPHLDGISWSFGMHAITEVFKFQSGDLDLIRELNQADLTFFKTDARWMPYGEALADTSINGESMNTRMPPFDNIEVRRAVAAAIDREQLRVIKPANLRVTTGVLPAGIPGFDPTFEGQKYDYAAALEHMRKAGYPYDPATGQGGYPKTIPYLVFQQGLYEYTGQVLQQQLARIGIRIEIRAVSWPAYLAAAQREGQTPMTPQSWDQDYPDPSSFFEPIFGSAAIQSEGSSNTSFYSNPKLDALLERAHREIDPAIRTRLYREANAIVCDEAPWAFTYSYHWFEVRQPYLRGYQPNPMWPSHVGMAWLDRGAGKTASRAAPLWRDALGAIFGTKPARAGVRP